MNQPPIFIVGMGRSGTTLLRLMLHSHPRIAIPYESGFLTAHHERMAEYGDLRIDANFRRLIDVMLAEPTLRMWDHAFDANRLFGAVRARSVAGAADAIYSEYAAGKGKARWGDKSDYLGLMHVINDMFPTAQFIHIIRDGRDVASSVLKLPWGPDDIVRAAEWWNEHVWLGRRVGAILGRQRYLEVRYERLVMNPEHELRTCCTFLGEDYSGRMLSYHASAGAAIPSDRRWQHQGYDAPPDPARVYAWKREMSPYDVALFNRHAGRMLRELDYEIPADSVSLPAIGLRYLMILARRVRSRAA